ncbi:HNH endonuclease [Corynebacterium striatum]
MAGWGGRSGQRLRKLCLETYGDICHLCGRPGADSADHIIPRSMGGDNSIDNLRPAHTRCNAARGNMPMHEWRRRHAVESRPRSKPSRDW